MSSLLLWKIIGYGVLVFFALGIVVKIFNVIAPILRLFFFVGFCLLALVTYPFVLLIRAAGYRKCQSLFPILQVFFDTDFHQEHEKPQQKKPNKQQSSVDEESRQAKPKEQPFDPWVILEVPRNASKQEIKAAYKNKIVLNHPDKVASLDPALQNFATQRTVLLQKAYEQLVGSA